MTALRVLLAFAASAAGSDAASREKRLNELVATFEGLPLEGKDESDDWNAYRRSCETADFVARKIWKATGDPDKVIDFWALQRKRYDAEAEKCESARRRAEEKVRASAQGGDESRRFHNLRCMYLHSIEMDDERTLMEVVSNKFFTASREDFDRSMNGLRKSLGRNIGYDEQLRLLHPDKR